MELCSRNFYDTSTQIVVGSNTLTSSYILSRDVRRQYVTEAYNSDLLTASITIQFDTTQAVDRIVMMGHNVKAMNIFYNGVTANAFALTGPTTTSQFTGNTAEDLYLPVTAVTYVTSVTFDLKSTMVANSEKAVGYILISAREYTFPRIPAAGDYKPNVKPKENKHEMSDGGSRTHTIAQKWNTKIKYKHLPESDRDALKDVYDEHEPKVFIPFNTTTGWDGILFECNMTGPFDFYTFSENALTSGFTGTIVLEET